MACLKNTKYSLQVNNHLQLPVIPKADEDIQYFAFWLWQLQSINNIQQQELTAWTAAQ